MKTKPKTSIIYPDPLPDETLEELIARARKAFRDREIKDERPETIKDLPF